MAHLERHALAHLAHHTSLTAAPRVLWHAAIFHVGAPATLIAFGLALWRLVRTRGGPAATPTRGSPAFAFEIGAVLGWTVLYLLVPYESAYTLPALPSRCCCSHGSPARAR